MPYLEYFFIGLFLLGAIFVGRWHPERMLCGAKKAPLQFDEETFWDFYGRVRRLLLTAVGFLVVTVILRLFGLDLLEWIFIAITAIWFFWRLLVLNREFAPLPPQQDGKWRFGFFALSTLVLLYLFGTYLAHFGLAG